MKSHKAVPFLVAVYILIMFAAQSFAAVIYVDTDATSGANSGSSWTNAYTDLQDALSAVVSGDEIWVAAGTYKPSTATIPTVTDRKVSFVMKEDVAIYGGFSGTETSRDQRNWTTNVTILSGDIGTAGDNSDNSYHVVTSSGAIITSTSVLDGFIISGGNANGSSFPANCGGGIHNDGSNLTVSNCTFFGNSARYGGGMLNNNSSPTVNNCTFYGNTVSYGGGMYNSSSNPTVTECTFSGNIAIVYGGGIYNDSSNPAVTDCTFSGNTTPRGGGMYNKSSNPTVVNCTFSMNTSSSTGGGMYNKSSNPTVIDCAFSGNIANYGGGMYSIFSGSPTVVNCTFFGNTAIAGGGIYNHSSKLDVTGCAFSGNSAEYGGGMFNSSSNLTVTNCAFSGNTASVYGGGMYNDFSRPMITNCTFSRNTASVYGGGMYNTGTMTISTLISCILWCNSSDEIYDDTSTSIVNYSIVKGGYTGTGNLDTDPLFVDSSSGNFRLQGTSPAIDAGDDAAVPAGVTTDIDGNPRIAGAAVNMGAYESLASGSPLPPVIPGPPLPIVITAEVSDITATGAVSGGNVIYPEGCTALLVGRGVVWDTVSPPTYPEDAATLEGWESGEYTSALTNLVPQTRYYIRAYVQYKLHNVLYTRYSEYIHNFTTPALPGDVNGDKILDLKDAILALKIVAGAAGNAAINLPADVDGDEKIGVEEAVYVLQNVGSAE